jgi:hypothetical protein
MGWLESPERQAVFVVCGSCSDCADAELEKRIVDKINAIRPETVDTPAPAVEAPPALEPAPAAVAPEIAAATTAGIYSPPAAAGHPAQAKWAAKAAAEWTKVLTAPPFVKGKTTMERCAASAGGGVVTMGAVRFPATKYQAPPAITTSATIPAISGISAQRGFGWAACPGP